MAATFEVAPTPKTAPFYRVTLLNEGEPFMRLLYVPSRHRMRVWQEAPYLFQYGPGNNAPYWRSVSATGAAVLAKTVAGLTPFMAPRAWR